MATRSETVNLSQKEIEEAIQSFLTAKYGGDPHSNPYRIKLHYSRSSSGHGWAEVDSETFTCSATREVK